MAKPKTQSKAKSSSKSRKKVASKASGSASWREAWHVTLKALGSAEREVDTQVRGLLTRNKLSRADAQKLLDRVGARLQKERERTLKEMQAGVKKLQKQVKREQKNLNSVVDDAVEQALAALNIPSRRSTAASCNCTALMPNLMSCGFVATRFAMSCCVSGCCDA